MQLRPTRSATERVLQFLRLRAKAHGEWELDGNLKQLAEDIGLRHEALYRTLASLEQKGRIARRTGKLILLA
ncbi:hypothetical protein [Noviherbaspirillum saxi]|uniref:HTH crp-type domain-containing protein n=1 Tax=Noviherbaspirillum saxi TaxID=2320863 RepID=A0A3A3FQP1_9BURK|nr:hypothetical protein [Noviherbaspirillum saxi]RJF98173.1 hypothetical protein D3871_06350 [Noviherbaspirillum saxi]